MKHDEVFSIISEGGDSDPLTILMYGTIGRNWWDDEDITDTEFYKAFSASDKPGNRIDLRINSPGGSMLHGNAIVSLIKGAKADVHVYNDGLCASMAGMIFLSAPKENRHMSDNAVLMVHNASSGAWGNAKTMREAASRLDVYDATMLSSLCDCTGKTEEEVKAEYLDYSDHYFTAKESKEHGFITDISSEKLDKTVKKTDAHASVNAMRRDFFESVSASATNPSLPKSPKAPVMPKSKVKPVDNMNSIDQVKAALAAGDVTKEQLTALLGDGAGASASGGAPPAGDPPKEEKDVAALIAEAVEPLKAKIKTLEGKTPPPAAPQSSGDPLGLSAEEKEYQEVSSFGMDFIESKIVE